MTFAYRFFFAPFPCGTFQLELAGQAKWSSLGKEVSFLHTLLTHLLKVVVVVGLDSTKSFVLFG
jgi:hypothetical protein